MTVPTAEGAAGDAPTRPTRAARRGPADLPFTFPDRELAESLAADRSEPDWLRAERLAAFEAYDDLPVEANRLYTPYVDLRGAELMAVRPHVRTAARPSDERATSEIPDGTSGIIELREDDVTELALSGEAIAAGVILETFATALGAGSGRAAGGARGWGDVAARRQAGSALARLLDPGCPAVRAARRPTRAPDPDPVGGRQPGPGSSHADARAAG